MKQMAWEQVTEGLGFILSVIWVLEDFETGNDMFAFISFKDLSDYCIQNL